MIFGQLLENGINTLRKTHVEHFVGLVEHDVVYVVELCYTTIDEVDQSSRCGHNNLNAMAQHAYLAADVGAAIHGRYVHTVDVLRKGVEIVTDLQTEFTRGT